MSSVDGNVHRTAYEVALQECLAALGTDRSGPVQREHAVIAVAIGMLMQAGNCDERTAAATLARASARSDQRLGPFAARLVEIQNTGRA